MFHSAAEVESVCAIIHKTCRTISCRRLRFAPFCFATATCPERQSNIVMHTMADFISTFVAALIGAAVGLSLRPRRPAERRCPSATAVQVVALALGMALPQLVFQFYPQLSHGWIRYATLVILVWIFFLPATWWAGRMRRSS